MSDRVWTEVDEALHQRGQLPEPPATPEALCRRITDPAPVPFAVEQAARRTCIEQLADGWCTASDLCPSCTRRFMAALDGIGGPLKWHENYLARAAEGVAR